MAITLRSTKGSPLTYTEMDNNFIELQSLKDSAIVSVSDFGAVGNGVTDDTSAIQNAITYASTLGNRTTVMLDGYHVISRTLTVTTSNISITGYGADFNHDVGAQGTQSKTRLMWQGAVGGTMLTFSSVEGASAQKLNGGGVSNVYFGCANRADIGLQVLSWRGGTFNNLFFNNPVVCGIDINVVSTLGESRDSQNNRFINCSSRQLETTGTVGGLLRIGGGNGANTSFNYFENLSCSFKSGDAYTINNSDNNLFVLCRANRSSGGTGNAIVLNGSNDDAARVARNNTFEYFATNGNTVGIICRGTTTFTHPSYKNSFFMLDSDNNTPQPTIETGSSSYFSDSAGLVKIGTLIIDGLENFANDVAAAAGGIGVNEVYRNGSILQIRVS